MNAYTYINICLLTFLLDKSTRMGSLEHRIKNSKEAISNLQSAKEKIETTRLEIERAERSSDLETAARLRYGTLRELEDQLLGLEARIKQIQASGALLKEEVDAEEIAEIVSRWTGIPVTRLLEGEMRLPFEPNRNVRSFRPMSRAQPWTADQSRDFSCFVVASGGHGGFLEKAVPRPPCEKLQLLYV